MTPTVEDLLAKGLAIAEVTPVHLVIRGTAQPDSVRCEWRGVARTPEQREAAIRFWLALDERDPLPSAAETERLFMEKLDQGSPLYPETIGANFKALARGGLSTNYLFLTCYVDYTVQEFLWRVYRTALHEAGHALGIRYGVRYEEGVDDQGTHHPSTLDSVMSQSPSIYCSPHPLDVMAIYALYQTVD